MNTFICDITNIKDSCVYLNKKICELIKQINKKCDYKDVKNDHYNITCKLSNIVYKNLYDFYSKKISLKQFRKNKKIIKKIYNKYNYSCNLLINNFFVNNDKYLIYLNENLKKPKKAINKFLENFKEKIIIEDNEVIISLYNIYNIIDSQKDICNKKQIYYEFIKKIRIHERRFKRYFENQIKSNLKNKNYISNIAIDNNINLISLSKFQQKINDINIIEKYIELKKSKLSVNDLLPIELFSSNCESKFILQKDDLINIFSAFGDNYVELITNKMDNDIFVNITTANMGVNISDTYGNSMILFNESNTIEDNYILIHELGHSIYNYYVNNKLLISKDILSSEICALVNELLLNDYFMKNGIVNSTYFLDSIMKIIVDGIVEYDLSKYIYIKNNVNYFSIKKEYIKILKKIYGNNLSLENSDLDMIINNNILNGIYLLRYVFALIISINIKIKIDDDLNYVSKYQKFIKDSSNSKSIDELLNMLDIDINDDSIYENVIKYIVICIK